MKRVLIGIAVFIAAVAICWYGGMDIMERGMGNALALVYSLISAGFAAYCVDYKE